MALALTALVRPILTPCSGQEKALLEQKQPKSLNLGPAEKWVWTCCSPRDKTHSQFQKEQLVSHTGRRAKRLGPRLLLQRGKTPKNVFTTFSMYKL